MLQQFERFDVTRDGVRLNARRGGKGEPLLLLHGHPQTHDRGPIGLGPRPSVAPGEVDPDLVPPHLGIDEDAVEVEDHGIEGAARVAHPGAGSGRPSSAARRRTMKAASGSHSSSTPWRTWLSIWNVSSRWPALTSTE